MDTKTDKEHDDKASELWKSFNEDERAGCKFGMFPYNPMTKVEKEGFDGHKMVVRLMNIATKNHVST